jgi:hypothetical protein
MRQEDKSVGDPTLQLCDETGGEVKGDWRYRPASPTQEAPGAAQQHHEVALDIVVSHDAGHCRALLALLHETVAALPTVSGLAVG